MVQPEDGFISLRDYHQQMMILNYLHSIYPQVHISLHAGELTPQLVTNADLKNHIHDALFIAHAQRIGHGVDILNEEINNNRYSNMRDNQVAVEINLISNRLLLDVYGAKHPLNFYLGQQVPVVLSTDDEGF